MTLPVPEIFFSPQKAIDELKNSFSVTNAVIIQLSAWLSCLTGLFLLSGRQATLGQFIFMVIFSALFLACFKTASALMMHLFAESLGGEGKITKLMFLLCYADVPLHFFLPLGLLLKNASFFWIAPIFMLIAAWVLSLTLKTLKSHYGLSGPRAFAAAAAPSLLVIAPLGALLTMVAGFFAGSAILISQIFHHMSLIP